MNRRSLLIGAVAYSPKVVTIWEGFRSHFCEHGVDMDYVLFSNYERQLESLLSGVIDIAWNTPLAHVKFQLAANGNSVSLGMRDTDRDFKSVLIVRADSGIMDLKDLNRKCLAVGSADSTQARILPLYFLEKQGVDLSDVDILEIDSDAGKHGDTGNSELEVINALVERRADAGVIGEPTWQSKILSTEIIEAEIRSVWSTPGFDHCMFDALSSLDSSKQEGFKKALFALTWENPSHRVLLELEGLRQWLPPREFNYDALREALGSGGRYFSTV
jgi:ABC-type phosphate/phosphonate transport system substrate-binding protein